jgi:RNase P subunit RPR2
VKLVIVLDCKTCRQSLPHLEEMGVRSGRLFLSCSRCGTIQNIPITDEIKEARSGSHGEAT